MVERPFTVRSLVFATKGVLHDRIAIVRVAAAVELSHADSRLETKVIRASYKHAAVRYEQRFSTTVGPRPQ